MQIAPLMRQICAVTAAMLEDWSGQKIPARRLEVGFAAVAAVRVFNVNALGVPDCDHSYSCIVVMRRDRFQARS